MCHRLVKTVQSQYVCIQYHMLALYMRAITMMSALDNCFPLNFLPHACTDHAKSTLPQPGKF